MWKWYGYGVFRKHKWYSPEAPLSSPIYCTIAGSWPDNSQEKGWNPIPTSPSKILQDSTPHPRPLGLGVGPSPQSSHSYIHGIINTDSVAHRLSQKCPREYTECFLYKHWQRRIRLSGYPLL